MSLDTKLEENIINSTEQPKEEIKIPAVNVRSGLGEIEVQASKIIQRLENLKTTSDNPLLQSSSAPSGFLNSEKKRPSEIITTLEALILNSLSDCESEDESEFPLPALNEISNLALVCNSIVAYISHLDRHQLAKVTSRIITDTNRWLSHVFRFIECSASYHSDNTESILRAIRLAIVSRCPGYLEGGVQALAYPCLYVSEHSSVVGLQYACRQLGLPLDSIRLVPSGGGGGVMDISTLQKMISTDITSNRTPLFVIADLGAAACGFVDNIMRLQDICKASGVWLHCRGHSLAALALTQGVGEFKSIADSMSLNLGSWLGIPTLPVVLLHRQIQNIALSVFETDPLKSRRLSSLSLWATLQAFGHETITEKILIAFESCKMVYDIVSKLDGLRVLSKIPGGEQGIPLIDLMNKPLNPTVLFECAVGMVTFQFDATYLERELMNMSNINNGDDDGGEQLESTKLQSQEDKNQLMINKSIEKIANASYFDKLNSWLGQIIQRDSPQVILEIVDHPVYGTFLRYCPLELGLGENVPSVKHLEIFGAALEAQTDILKATVRHKMTLNALVEKSDVLRLVYLPNWAGLGGVRFVPEGWETLLTDQAKTELNKLNTDLVDTLKSTDNAFSLGEGADSLTCVRFGMVTHDTDVEELLELVISVGKKVQENSKVLDSMTEIVKKGIEAATADLQRETEEKLWSEGILRHVPVFGNFVNWFSPPQKEGGIKGRSLNLTQGVVESTENIYKYHMQIAAGTSQLPGKNPPTPIVQTSVSGHSRTVSSQSSNGGGGGSGSGTSNIDAL